MSTAFGATTTLQGCQEYFEIFPGTSPRKLRQQFKFLASVRSNILKRILGSFMGTRLQCPLGTSALHLISLNCFKRPAVRRN